MYKVNELIHSDFHDYSELNDWLMSAGSFHGIIKVHHICYEKTGDPIVRMSREIDENLTEVNYTKRGGRMSLQSIKTCYTKAPGINQAKNKT